MAAVPATAIPFIKSFWLDNNGNKLNGGLLFSYAAGTSSKQATYTDATSGTQNANPVVLDANGRADVFLDPTISPYKFVLSPSTDSDPPTNAIWTEDNIWPAFNGGAPFTLTAAAVNETSLTLASAATVNIGAAKANYIFISGAVTITAFDTVQSGVERTLEFQGALTLTQNATSLILPGAANITTAAGDTAKFRSEGSGNWRCVTYQKTTNWTNAVVDATNGGIGVTITGGSAALKVNPSDLLTKTTPTTSDSIVIEDAAASNAAKTATIPAVVGALFSPITNSLGGDVALNNTANFFDGPSVAQGSTGTWLAFGTVSVDDTSNAATQFAAKLWDGTTTIDSAFTGANPVGGHSETTISLSGFIVSPAGNIRISVKDPSATTGLIKANGSGAGKDSTVTAIRIA